MEPSEHFAYVQKNPFYLVYQIWHERDSFAFYQAMPFYPHCPLWMLYAGLKMFDVVAMAQSYLHQWTLKRTVAGNLHILACFHTKKGISLITTNLHVFKWNTTYRKSCSLKNIYYHGYMSSKVINSSRRPWSMSHLGTRTISVKSSWAARNIVWGFKMWCWVWTFCWRNLTMPTNIELRITLRWVIIKHRPSRVKSTFMHACKEISVMYFITKWLTKSSIISVIFLFWP